MSERNDFVVYAYAREGADRFGNIGTYYYIGKGTPRRPFNCSKRLVKCPKNKKNIHILYDNLDEETAFKIEKELIAKYGREDVHPDWGILLNRTDGGDGVSGFLWSEGTHPNYIARCWSHVEYGFVYKKSCAELLRSYPEHNLSANSLYKLSKGEQNSHNGWVLVEDNLIDFNKSVSELEKNFSSEYAKNKINDHVKKIPSRDEHWNYKPRCWCHTSLGFFRDVSCSELVKKFPELDLSDGHLGELANGNINYYKGWIFIELNNKYIKESNERLAKVFSCHYARSVINRIKKEQKKG